ncbi:Lrp/AsnC family transcriptional regulator [Heyndrickxia sporothermodurans]|uniref:Lrp/AsnC family transcriptional regulator n=2 Tax=Heyndrickxia sporothermodurans TaxID=46224 RepID=A0AB37HEW4_9BACI|nr:Lrp/AsnC family transcriptional regulator [Heyndrickxia sporothermodurans]MBL5768173.1 Lrp/AsnC family transcriptional regulator [Heyndrickxia sporothermodurans]MBL5771826.1 Lrp/AsnC family transcriptional regulator [Heyndrickxia sporothermodurans]MBL5778767.1 Lrp/AsnC family transcriptional regulator [Heyndrickxia sporothermodurans]MBL5782542.1 Lrp/AsnC family transcriptional regulator [Heyndrickxia sporothermodurans]MBL5786081.1 Lrp/AsnC family transcriptional regulator [Heyndrickxia spor
MQIDTIDKKIIDELSKNSRLSMSELGRRINLSSPSVTERVRRMESFGVIKRYTLEVDYGKLGLPIQCIIEATIKNGDYQSFKKYIEGLSNVEFCYRIAGNACYMLKMQFETFAKAEEFIDDVNPYAHTVTHFIFSKIETNLRIGSD